MPMRGSTSLDPPCTDCAAARRCGKVRSPASRRPAPGEIKPIVYQEVRRLAFAVHRALGYGGVGRANFHYDDTGNWGLVCLKVNTPPDVTETSLVVEIAAHAGVWCNEPV